MEVRTVESLLTHLTCIQNLRCRIRCTISASLRANDASLFSATLPFSLITSARAADLFSAWLIKEKKPDTLMFLMDEKLRFFHRLK